MTDLSRYPSVDLSKLPSKDDSGNYTVYCIIHRDNKRKYIGQTKNLKTRLAQHRCRPPKRMKQDWETQKEAGKTWSEVFDVKVLERLPTKSLANTAEESMTIMLKTTSKDGYNKVKGEPFMSGRYYIKNYNRQKSGKVNDNVPTT